MCRISEPFKENQPRISLKALNSINAGRQQKCESLGIHREIQDFMGGGSSEIMTAEQGQGHPSLLLTVPITVDTGGRGWCRETGFHGYAA